eukprot:3063908-Pyramimonas_sp.AAC.1
MHRCVGVHLLNDASRKASLLQQLQSGPDARQGCQPLPAEPPDSGRHVLVGLIALQQLTDIGPDVTHGQAERILVQLS